MSHCQIWSPFSNVAVINSHTESNSIWSHQIWLLVIWSSLGLVGHLDLDTSTSEHLVWLVFLIKAAPLSSFTGPLEDEWGCGLLDQPIRIRSDMEMILAVPFDWYQSLTCGMGYLSVARSYLYYRRSMCLMGGVASLVEVTCLEGRGQDGGHVDPPGFQLMSQSIGEKIESSFWCSICSQAWKWLITCRHRYTVMS